MSTPLCGLIFCPLLMLFLMNLSSQLEWTPIHPSTFSFIVSTFVFSLKNLY